MSVLAPPPSPTPSHFDALSYDSDAHVHHSTAAPTTAAAAHAPHAAPPRPRSDMASADAPASLKRKPSSQDPLAAADNRQSNSEAEPTPLKKPKTAGPSLVEIKNGKLHVRQKPLNWLVTMPVMRAIIEFQTFLTSVDMLSEVPEEQLHVVAKLVQESDKTINELTKLVRSSLMPEALADDSQDDVPLPSSPSSSGATRAPKLTLPAIARAIETVAERRNYGLDISHIPSASDVSSGDLSIPPGLQLWRWEVKDTSLLPKENLDKILLRRKEREDVRDQVASLFASLPESERQALLKRTGRTKTTASSTAKQASAISAAAGPSTSRADEPIVIDDGDDNGPNADVENIGAKPQTPSRPRKRSLSKASSAQPTTLATSQDKAGDSASPKKKERAPAKAELSPGKLKEREEKEAAKTERLKAQLARKAEREAKEAEKQRLKEAKEAELQKKQDLKKKQASFFTSFMQKAQTRSPHRPALTTTPLSTKSDFERTFLPCQYKDLAPINRFSKPQRELELGQSELTRERMLADLMKSMPKRNRKPWRKGVHPPVSVREIKRIVTESDVLGGNAEELARKALEDLKDRRKVPMKLLQFETDRRPGWYGTWTRSTNLIGPRCPLGQDPVALDYNYDSDAEWEELGQVDGDDVLEADDKEESAGESDSDSDLDDWLVDDLEVDEEDEAMPMADGDDIVEVDAQGHPVLSNAFGPNASRNAGAGATNVLKPKKKKVKMLGRRFDSKLVPFSTGPHWEGVLGQPDYEHFNGYQIEFLNDACFGLNPFTFQSAAEEEPAGDVGAPAEAVNSVASSPTKLAASTGSRAPIGGGVLAALWGVARNDAAMPGSADAAGAGASAGLKLNFPDAEVPALLRAIEGSTKTRAGLVDDLKERFEPLGRQVSKNALNERVAYYAAKEGKKPGSAWRVKDEFRKLAGL
ncbi:hypothetical protein ACQY0O_000110 [Thecaphora frezii]